MVIALLALGLVMILGGIAAVVQGFPYVHRESGLAMVLGGTTAASAGAVILGLAAIVLWLKRMQAAVIAARFPVQDTPSARDIVSAAPVAGDLPMSAAPVAVAGLGGAAFGELTARAAAGPEGGPMPEVEPEERIAAQPASTAEPWLPEPQARPEPLPAPPEEPAPAAGPGPHGTPLPDRESEPEMVLRPSLDPDAAPDKSPEPAPIEPAAAPAQDVTAETHGGQAIPEEPPAANPDQQPADSPLEVIGTYSSGGNTYVMFADGTIEAETPRGRFTFNSLDELKDFVDSGGEYETRGAA